MSEDLATIDFHSNSGMALVRAEMKCLPFWCRYIFLFHGKGSRVSEFQGTSNPYVLLGVF